MGDLSEFKTTTRLFLKPYPWRRIDPVPWTQLDKPLSECRLTLISSAGFVLPDQDPFDWSIPGGDVSFREIPSDVNISDLTDCQKSKSYDHSGLRHSVYTEKLEILITAGFPRNLDKIHLLVSTSLGYGLTAPSTGYRLYTVGYLSEMPCR